MANFDICIIGGGPAGFTLASLLAGSGLHILLADAAPPCPKLADVKPDGRTAALMGGSIQTLERAGVWPLLKDYGSPLKRMAVIDDSRFPAGADKMIEQSFDAAELGREAFGWNMPLTAMRAALNDHLAAFKNVTVTFNARMKMLEHGDVTFEDNKKIHTSLVVGCDGKESAVRAQGGIAVKRKPYDQSAITCLIKHTRSHNDTSVEFHRPGGPFTIVPMQGDMSAIVWVEHTDDADALLKLPRAAFVEQLEQRTRGRVGKIEMIGNPAAWKLEYLRSSRLTGDRIALAAEAAHVISPIGAQGLNLSLRDVQTLSDIVTQGASLGLDIGSPTILNRYEKARHSDVASRSFAIDMVNQAVATDGPAMRALRRLTLRALSLPGPWRQLVMKKGLAA